MSPESLCSSSLVSPRGFPMDVWPDASGAVCTLASRFPFFPQMADAMEMMILSILAPQLHCEWRLPSWQVALLTSVGSPAVHSFPWRPVGRCPSPAARALQRRDRLTCFAFFLWHEHRDLERKGLIPHTVPQQSALLGEVSAGTQGGTWRQELKRTLWRTTAYCLAPRCWVYLL